MASDLATDQTLGEFTYRLPGITDHTLDENGLEDTCPLDNNKHSIDPQYSLGLLDTLPLEVLCNVLVDIDVRSLTDFRRVKKRAMQVVDSIPEYQQTFKTCPALLRGLLSTELAANFSCEDLIETLHASKCATCGDFAGYIYILTCTRVCFLCFSGTPDYFPLQPAEAARKFGVPRGLLASLPRLSSIPKVYSSMQKTRKTRLTLIDLASARRLSVEHHGSAEAVEQHVAETIQKSLEQFLRRVNAQRPGYTPRGPPSACLEEGPMQDTRRFMAIVRAPSIMRPANTVERGFHCIGCKHRYMSRRCIGGGNSAQKHTTSTLQNAGRWMSVGWKAE